MMKQYLMVVIATFCILVVCVACSIPGISDNGSGNAAKSQTSTVKASSTSSPAAGPTLSPASVQSIPTAMNYYQAIKQKDYAKAFSFVDANATTTDGKKLTESVLAQMASAEDTNYGPISNVEMVPASNDGTQLVLTIDRGSGLHYHTHLTMKKDGSNWMIVSVDRI